MSDIQQTKEVFWETKMEEFRSSGLSQKKWCASQGISYSTFRYWIKKVETTPSESELPLFVPVEKEALFPSSSPAPILFRFSTASIEISPQCSPDFLEQLVLLLKKYAII